MTTPNQTDQGEALLPCPICGDQPDKPVDATKLLGVWRIIHRCPIMGFMETSADLLPKAAAKWNTRASQTEANRLREQLAAATDAERGLKEERDAYRQQTSSACAGLEVMNIKQSQLRATLDGVTYERDAATAEVEKLRGLLSEARTRIKREKQYVIDYKNCSVTVPPQPCLADRIDAALPHSAVAMEAKP